MLQDESAVDEEGDDAERDALVGDHARRMFVLAREMLRISAATQAPDGSGPIKIRIGLHVGPVVAAVVGTRMLRCVPPSPPTLCDPGLARRGHRQPRDVITSRMSR